jgi:mono/diheme cytochrome c family protein
VEDYAGGKAMNRFVPFATVMSAVITAAAISGCAHEPPNRTGEISTTKLRSDPRLAEGQRAFMQYCNQCHVGGGGGIGPSLNDKWMPSFFIKLKVRHGIGKMPHFSDRVVSDEQLDDMIRYLGYLHEHPRDLRA